MDTWQGDFGWQNYALSGRPDLLNYLRHGDFTWPDMWSLFQQQGLPDRIVLAKCMRLFHQYLSWQFDMEGGLPDPDGDVVRDLMSWACFCVANREALHQSVLREELVALVEGGGVSPAYLECAYQCYIRALVDNHSRGWPAAAEAIGLDGGEESSPPGGYGTLEVYIPEDSPELPMAGDPDWQRFKRAVARQEHKAWCASYSRLVDRLDEMMDDRPGL